MQALFLSQPEFIVEPPELVVFLGKRPWEGPHGAQNFYLRHKNKYRAYLRIKLTEERRRGS